MSNNSFEATRLSMKVAKPGEVEHAEGLSDQELYEISYEAMAECSDGCIVEPDGHCEHGYSSPLIILGLI